MHTRHGRVLPALRSAGQGHSASRGQQQHKRCSAPVGWRQQSLPPARPNWPHPLFRLGTSRAEKQQAAHRSVKHGKPCPTPCTPPARPNRLPTASAALQQAACARVVAALATCLSARRMGADSCRSQDGWLAVLSGNWPALLNAAVPQAPVPGNQSGSRWCARARTRVLAFNAEEPSCSGTGHGCNERQLLKRRFGGSGQSMRWRLCGPGACAALCIACYITAPPSDNLVSSGQPGEPRGNFEGPRFVSRHHETPPAPQGTSVRSPGAVLAGGGRDGLGEC